MGNGLIAPKPLNDAQTWGCWECSSLVESGRSGPAVASSILAIPPFDATLVKFPLYMVRECRCVEPGIKPPPLGVLKAFTC